MNVLKVQQNNQNHKNIYLKIVVIILLLMDMKHLTLKIFIYQDKI